MYAYTHTQIVYVVCVYTYWTYITSEKQAFSVLFPWYYPASLMTWFWSCNVLIRMWGISNPFWAVSYTHISQSTGMIDEPSRHQFSLEHFPIYLCFSLRFYSGIYWFTWGTVMSWNMVLIIEMDWFMRY